MKCSVPGCGGVVRTKGLCVKHYSRWLRHGSTEPTKAWYEPGTLCAVNGCSLPIRGRGWCQGHYMRWYRYGDVMPDLPRPGLPSVDITERFWSKVNKTETCWLWTAATNNGRGSFRDSSRARAVLAHRFAYELLVGPIPAGMELDHLCRTPLCVNPNHLEPVDHAENMRRTARTHCPQGHPYDAENTMVRADGNKVCRACNKARSIAAYRRRKAMKEAAASA